MEITGMLSLRDKDIFELFKLEARSLGRRVVTDNENYMVIPGTDQRLWLVAHIDTVCHGHINRRIIMQRGIVSAFVGQSKKERAILGADDRAGCFALLQLMRKDARPTILLTNYEERGGRGVRVFVDETVLWKPAKLFIEFDRAGCNEYVQYNENPEAMHTWIKRFNVDFCRGGTYSDIRTISEKTRIPSFNMAIGYYRQHTEREYLDVAAMEMAITKAGHMINSFCGRDMDFGEIKIPEQRSVFSAERHLSGPAIHPVVSQNKSPERLPRGWVKVIHLEDSTEDTYECEACGASYTDGHKEECQYAIEGQNAFSFYTT